MSILIKGMKMPKNCHLCLYSYLGRDYSRIFCGIDDHYIADLQQWDKPYFWGHKDDSCPIIPVPDHGRLIDADALMLKILDYIEEYSDVDEKGWHNLKWCAMKETEMAINNAPTIIPADKDSET